MSSKTETARRFAVGAAIVLALSGAFMAIVRSDNRGAKGSGLGKEFSYDLTALRKVDPKLIHFSEKQAVDTGLSAVHALATGPADQIYVAGDRSIRVFDNAGYTLADFKTERAANCLAVAADGAIFLGMIDHIEVLDNKGATVTRWEAPNLNTHFTALAVSGNEILAADWGARTVRRYDRTGKLLGEIGRKAAASDSPGFVVPSPYFDVAVAPGGMLWVADTGRHQLESFSADGAMRSNWGKFSFEIDGFCGCCNPVHFALLPDGRFVTAEKGLARVKVYDAHGRFESVVAAPAQFNEQANTCLDDCRTGIALEVATDSKGRVLVLDPSARSVRIFVENAAVALQQ